MNILPSHRPEASLLKVTRMIPPEVRDIAVSLSRTVLVAVRGYFSRTFGEPGNDRGFYDDALFFVSGQIFVPFNFNVDPSTSRDGIASLKEGVWNYKRGTHGLSRPKEMQYEALIQAGPVTVRRDGGKEETGYFGINLHCGASGGTSSLGCQTVPPSQWAEFMRAIRVMVREGEPVLYVLADNAEGVRP